MESISMNIRYYRMRCFSYFVQHSNVSRCSLIGLVWCALLVSASNFAVPQKAAAQEADTAKIEDPNAIKFPVEMVDFHFLVVDEGQQPVGNGVVTIRGVRCKEDPGSWYVWPAPNVGPVKESETDAHGKVTLRYPVKFGSGSHYRTLDILKHR